ncbi:hypothetical protein C8Q77DRAFT_525005 [Trametes polyzona]|nr:hypothetical protein C8Q77DRAFT_525005 [Trametes polyzona]
MRATIPIQGRPEFTIIEYPGWLEYRVQAPGSSSRRPNLRTLGVDAVLVIGVARFWDTILINPVYGVFAAVLALLYVYSRVTRVIWESVVILPSLGIQLETHRGPSGIPLFASRRFVPWASLEDFLINEGLRGWDVRYYLVAVSRTQQGALKLDVAFENILPRFPILLKVYHAVQEAIHAENEKERRHKHSIRSVVTDSAVD